MVEARLDGKFSRVKTRRVLYQEMEFSVRNTMQLISCLEQKQDTWNMLSRCCQKNVEDMPSCIIGCCVRTVSLPSPRTQ